MAPRCAKVGRAIASRATSRAGSVVRDDHGALPETTTTPATTRSRRPVRRIGDHGPAVRAEGRLAARVLAQRTDGSPERASKGRASPASGALPAVGAQVRDRRAISPGPPSPRRPSCRAELSAVRVRRCSSRPPGGVTGADGRGQPEGSLSLRAGARMLPLPAKQASSAHPRFAPRSRLRTWHASPRPHFARAPLSAASASAARLCSASACAKRVRPLAWACASAAGLARAGPAA